MFLGIPPPTIFSPFISAVCILLLTCILFLYVTLFCCIHQQNFKWRREKKKRKKRVSECVFVISFSNFITSTEINLSNYGNIVVQPVVCYRLMVMASSPLLHYIEIYIFEYWVNGRTCVSCDMFSMVRCFYYGFGTLFLCYLLKMCIFHFVGINRRTSSNRQSTVDINDCPFNPN